MKAMTDPMYDRAPRIVIWEMTRACPLSCRHCRAEAIPRRDPNELTTAQAFRLVEDVAACDHPLFVLTGGDPLMRDDIYKIIEYGSGLNLSMSVAPAASGRLTRETMRHLASAGTRRISLSLDAPDAQAHDAFRGVQGSYRRTMEALANARDYGISVQVNSTVTKQNRSRLREFEAVLAPFDIALWSLFFVLPVGRAGLDMCLDPSDVDAAFADIHAVAASAPFAVKTTEAPHYRRYALQHEIVPPRDRETAPKHPPLRFPGIGDGRGFVFVSHHGDIQPSGFLSEAVGNVLQHSLLDIYRDHPVMRRLRRPETFEGKCGLCEFGRICGGSRARAYTTSGNPFASDPSCSYRPQAASALA